MTLFRTFVMFVIVIMQTIFHTECLSMCMVYLLSVFHMLVPRSRRVLVTTVKPKATCTFSATAVLSCRLFYKNIYLNDS
jgi:hypothetical protein